MGITLYFNADCPDCARQAARTVRLDWLDRIDLRTNESPLGAVPVGEIVVVEKKTGRIFTGVFAIRKACLQVPLLYPYGLLLSLPSVRRIVGGDRVGCNGDACEI